MQNSSISWTDHTFNPWIGCTKVSPGCLNCYAETRDKRQLQEKVLHWGATAPRQWLSENYWRNPYSWNRKGASERQRKRVFCASLCDVFEDRPDVIAPRNRLFEIIKNTPWLDWLLLTKRPENIERLAPELGQDNVWLGTSAEDQTRWDERVPILCKIPATVRFVSAEPLLGEIKMGKDRPEWLIVGGESGRGCREMNVEWARGLRDQCDFRTVFHFKQMGGFDKGSPLLDGNEHKKWPSAHPISLKIAA